MMRQYLSAVAVDTMGRRATATVTRVDVQAPAAGGEILRAPPNGTNRRRYSLDRRHLAGMGNTTRAGGTPALRTPPAWPPGIINGRAGHKPSRRDNKSVLLLYCAGRHKLVYEVVGMARRKHDVTEYATFSVN